MAFNLGNFVQCAVVYNRPGGDKDTEWDMNLEILATDGVTSVERAAGIAIAVQQFATRLMMDPFYVDRIILRDHYYSGDYNPEKIFIFTSGAEGNREAYCLPGPNSAALLPLTNVLNANKQVEFGYPGRLSLRGFLTEADIVSDDVSGAVVLANTSAIQTELSDAYVEFSDALGLLEAYYAMWPENPTLDNWRSVGDLRNPKAGVRQLNNKTGARYPGGLFGDIIRTIETVKDSLPALQAIAEVLDALGFLAPILIGGAGKARR